MGKNVVLCLDGTGNQVQAKASTNVVRLYEVLDLSNPAAQIAYYDPGRRWHLQCTGNMDRSRARVVQACRASIRGWIRENLAEAYTCNWEPGDKVFIFGFSRGAFAARALTGILYRAGVFRQGCENLVQYLVANYTGHRADDEWKQIDRRSAAFAHVQHGGRSVPIEFLGLWDSVRAAGILRRSMTWPYTRQLPNVQHAWHAVSRIPLRTRN